MRKPIFVSIHDCLWFLFDACIAIKFFRNNNKYLKNVIGKKFVFIKKIFGLKSEMENIDNLFKLIKKDAAKNIGNPTFYICLKNNLKLKSGLS